MRSGGGREADVLPLPWPVPPLRWHDRRHRCPGRRCSGPRCSGPRCSGPRCSGPRCRRPALRCSGPRCRKPGPRCRRPSNGRTFSGQTPAECRTFHGLRCRASAPAPRHRCRCVPAWERRGRGWGPCVPAACRGWAPGRLPGEESIAPPVCPPGSVRAPRRDPAADLQIVQRHRCVRGKWVVDWEA